jgi:hypothetical protein
MNTPTFKNVNNNQRGANTQNKATNNMSLTSKKLEKTPKYNVYKYEPLLLLTNENWSEQLNTLVYSGANDILPVGPDFNIENAKISLYHLIGSRRIELISKYFTDNKRHQLTDKEPSLVAALLLRINRFRLRLYFVTKLLSWQRINQPALNVKYQEFIKSLKSSQTILDFTTPPSSDHPPLTLASTINKLKKDFINHEKILKEFLLPFIDTFGLLHYPLIEREPPIRTLLKSLAPLGQTGIQPDSYYFWSVVLMGDDTPMFQKPSQIAQWSAYKTEIRLLLHFPLLCNDLPNTDVLISNNPSQKGNIINQPYSKFVTMPCSDTTFAAFINVANVLIPVLYFYSMACIHQNLKLMSESSKNL